MPMNIIVYKIFAFLVLLAILFSSCKNDETKPTATKENNPSPTLNKSKKTATTYKPSHLFDHIQHIRQISRIGHRDDLDNDPKYFVDYVIENLLEEKNHKKFITDRKLLRKLQNKVCWDNFVFIEDTLSKGENISIEISTRAFDTLNRILKYEEKSNFLIEVDGMYPFGAVYYERPRREIESLEIKINDKHINTSSWKYKNLYEPSFCNFSINQRITEAYEDGQFIYIYIFGGNAADSYFAKLIFDKTDGYVTSIIVDYIPLSMYGSFGEYFIGF